MDAQEKWYSVKEVAGMLGCSCDHIRRLVFRGHLKAIRLSVNYNKRKRRYVSLRISGTALAEFIRQRAA